jgi:hypothetical protein
LLEFAGFRINVTPKFDFDPQILYFGWYSRGQEPVTSSEGAEMVDKQEN